MEERGGEVDGEGFGFRSKVPTRGAKGMGKPRKRIGAIGSANAKVAGERVWGEERQTPFSHATTATQPNTQRGRQSMHTGESDVGEVKSVKKIVSRLRLRQDNKLPPRCVGRCQPWVSG